MDIQELHKLYLSSSLVDTDTRKIRKGSIFFALKGDNFNGNNYAKQAIEKGASYAIVDEVIDFDDLKIIRVENVLKTLQDLASFHRNYLGIPIIGITGSNGKTTTKELISCVLQKKYRVAFTKGNFNNHIGVPLTLLSMDSKVEIGVVEMGANHHKEIAFLSKIAAPDFGYITNFGKAHLEGFGSVQGVIEAKSELYEYIIANDKKVFVNQNDPIQLEKTKSGNQIFLEENCALKSISPFLNINFETKTIKTKLVGQYNFDNALIAITVGKYFGIPNEEIKLAIEGYEPNDNRSQIIRRNSNQIILDAYNANPTSMKAALDSFNLYEANNKIIILGDMFELGDDANKEHQELVNLASSYDFKEMYFIGELFNKTKTHSPKFLSFNEFKKYFDEQVFENTVFLIKGSRGMSLERVLDSL